MKQSFINCPSYVTYPRKNIDPNSKMNENYRRRYLFIEKYNLDSCLERRGEIMKYSSAPVSTGNTFQDLPRLRETADNTERYI
jgi:hypothetical protein